MIQYITRTVRNYIGNSTNTATKRKFVFLNVLTHKNAITLDKGNYSPDFHGTK